MSQEQFGPALGSRRPDEFGPHAAALLGDAQVGRRWGMADGCAFDAEGNLWVTLVLANKIVAVTPDGHATVVIEDIEGKLLNAPTSVAWGGAGYARCLHRLAGHALRPQGAQFGAGNADGPPTMMHRVRLAQSESGRRRGAGPYSQAGGIHA